MYSDISSSPSIFYFILRSLWAILPRNNISRFSPGTRDSLCENGRRRESYIRFSLFFASNKNYLFRFIESPQLQREVRVPGSLINVSRECRRKFVFLNKALSREKAFLGSLHPTSKRVSPEAIASTVALILLRQICDYRATNGICIPTSRQNAPRHFIARRIAQLLHFKSVLD